MSEVDQAIITIGPPKCGKTTLVRAACKEFLVQHKTGIALVHDVNHQFGDLCASYETVREWRVKRALAAETRIPFPRGAAFHGYGEASKVVDLAIALGHRHNAAHDVKMPIFVAFDETSMMEESGSTHIGRGDLRMITTRRHLGIAPVYNLQRESALMKAFFEQATDVYVFRQSNEESVRSIEIKLGVARGSLLKLLAADNFRYVHWRQSQGLV